MLYLLQALSVWLLAAYALGMIVGLLCWNAGAEDEKPNSWLSFFPFALALAVGVTAAWLRWLPGRYGLWLETGLLLLIAYLVGCWFGSFSRGRFSGGGMAAKPAPPARGRSESRSVAAPAVETTAAPETVQRETARLKMTRLEMAGEAESLAQSAAALAAVAPMALEVFSAAREVLGEGEPQAESDAPLALLSPPASAPRPEGTGEEDDLRLIQGVDDGLARRLQDLGVRRFEQIAAWTPQQPWIGENLGPVGPQVMRFWIAQARLLAGGVEPEFARMLRKGEPRRESREAALDEAAAGKCLAALPQSIAPHANDEIYAGLRPLALLLPPYGEKDDLCQIRGVDAATAQRLNALGVWTLSQIACWSRDNARWISSYLAFPGRVESENWIAQAREVAAK